MVYVADRSLLLWRSDRPWRGVSTASYGGGSGWYSWVVNATVDRDFSGQPEDRGAELLEQLGLQGRGCVLLTAVDVRHAVQMTDGGTAVTATVGAASQTAWAAAPPSPTTAMPGTINIVAWMPRPMAEAALINAVITATEAKAQAFRDARLEGTGTCTDAVVILCPAGEPDDPVERYGGPRSTLGAPLARAVHAAVLQGLRAEALALDRSPTEELDAGSPH